MIDISGIPNVDPATANLINGEMVDVTTPGDGTGTPVRVDWQSDLYYADIAVMNDAGIAADNSVEGATSSQFKDAILRLARRQVQSPGYTNLIVKRNAGTPNSKVDVTFDKMWIEGIEKTSGSYTIDITASGALGLDTGVESADAWYYIWMIAKSDGTVSALLSLSTTAPTLPAGYIYKRLISAVRNTGGNFVYFIQNQNNVVITEYLALNDGTATIYTAIDISAVVPMPITKCVNGYYRNTAPVAGGEFFISSDGVSAAVNTALASNAGNSFENLYILLSISATNIYYKTTAEMSIWISSFEINI